MLWLLHPIDVKVWGGGGFGLLFNFDNLTVQLGLAGTNKELELLVLVGGDKILHKVKVCEANFDDTVTMKAFFSVLLGAVHYPSPPYIYGYC